jgi:acetoin utilization protein AcuB
MSIEKIMSNQLITLDIDANLEQARLLFKKHNIHHILIVSKQELLGVITDRDLHKHLSPAIGTNKETVRDSSLLQKKVHLIMSRNLVTANQQTTLNEAVLLFHDNHISCLPIVDEKSHLLGIITWRDIIKILAQQYRQKKVNNK